MSSNTDTRHAALAALVEQHQERAKENYARIRGLAEALEQGYCAFLGADGPPCVLLVPPAGAFAPKSHGDEAFTAPPSGFQPLGPIAFGLAVRVNGDDWMRFALTCRKEGEKFNVVVENGPSYTFRLPLADQDPIEFFELLHAHVTRWFAEAIEDYDRGDVRDRAIGFDFFRVEPEAAE